MLEITAPLLLALVVADRHLGNTLALVVLALLVAAVGFTGVPATLHCQTAAPLTTHGQN